MTLSIYSNLMANSTARTLRESCSRLATSMQRLSFGLRINSAADDDAGLAVRELMRTDIAAIHQGIRNANDAISMIQTADGALSVIDEKLIRMKELAEQAATGTYDSTQRVIIDSEFQAMGAEIDRIARATDFNGIKLLDGSLSGTHDGSGLTSTGAMKIHFGTGNDSAEDYYYVEIGDATLAGLGLRNAKKDSRTGNGQNTSSKAVTSANIKFTGEGSIEDSGMIKPPVNTWIFNSGQSETYLPMTNGYVGNIQDVIPNQGEWYLGMAYDYNGPMDAEQNFMFIIPAGTKNIVINQFGTARTNKGDNDIQLFTKNGVHLAGTPLTDIVFNVQTVQNQMTDIDFNSAMLGFTMNDYDGSNLNTGPARWDSGNTLLYTQYNGMTIGYSGDGERQDSNPEDGIIDGRNDFEILTIDEATEDLIVWLPGIAGAYFQYFIDYNPAAATNPTLPNNDGNVLSVATQSGAQQALPRIDEAIIRKDQIRAHLGALQNRLENTVTNLAVQAENLQASESRLSDTDVAAEMTELVRNQILTQSATAMLIQANSLPQMLAELLEG